MLTDRFLNNDHSPLFCNFIKTIATRKSFAVKQKQRNNTSICQKLQGHSGKYNLIKTAENASSGFSSKQFALGDDLTTQKKFKMLFTLTGLSANVDAANSLFNAGKRS